MKKNVFYVLVLFSSLLLYSCNKHESDPVSHSGGINETVPLQVLVNIGKSHSLKSRSTLTTFPEKSEIGIFVTSGVLGNNYNGIPGNSNVRATLAGSVWTTTPAVYLSNRDATLFAYYPYSSSSVDGAAIPVEHITQTDYLYGTHTNGQPSVNNGNPTVNLTLQHALSLLQFKISKINYTGAGVLSKIEIANVAGKTVLYSEGTMDISTGDITHTTGKNESAVIESNNLQTISEALPANETMYPKIMVLPANIITGDEIEMRFTIDGKVYASKVNASTVWAKGTKNTYTITIQGTGITIGSVVISDWTDGISGSVSLK